MSKPRLVVVSNRLPIVLNKQQNDWIVLPGSGGLVTALSPVLRHRGGLWIGWLGLSEKESPGNERIHEFLAKGTDDTGYALQPIALSEHEIDLYYHGFSNEILWPLFHDQPIRGNFNPAYWDAYLEVNRKFAASIAEHTDEEDYIWVHDYQLIQVANELKQLGVRRKIGLFLHIPFPPLDIYLSLPWRFQILEGLLDYDLLGFQTMRDRRNFLGCVRALKKGRVRGKGPVCTLMTPERELRVGAFPISIDFKEFDHAASTEEVSKEAWIAHANLPNLKIILGVDRLDYTKGIPVRLKAFADALERYPQMHGKVALLQVVVPSRRGVGAYEQLKHEIECLVGEINGRFTQVGWTPVHYIFRSLTRTELIAYYRTCEIALITPLKDGMNLVAKEYCACSIEENGVVILSEFAGAAAQMYQNAILVNPYDIRGTADAIYQAFCMQQDERRRRMRRLRRSIRKNDIFRWVNAFLKAGIAKDLNDFSQLDYYLPQE